MAKAKKKYELTDETMVVGGVTLHRIRALVAIAAIGVAAGDLGGWIEREENLEQVFGNAWVSGDAQVYGYARVYGDAQVYGDARVYGNARVYGYAQVSGNARVYGNAWVSGNAWVYGDAQVSGNARVYAPIICATRTDGYTFVVAHDQHYVVRIIAGCRYLTPDEARRHWTDTRGGTKLGDESLALVDHLERMAKLQGWPSPVAAE